MNGAHLSDVNIHADHGTLARIELAPDQISRFLEPGKRNDIVTALKEAGYLYITIGKNKGTDNLIPRFGELSYLSLYFFHLTLYFFLTAAFP